MPILGKLTREEVLLWEEYKRTKDITLRNKLVVMCLRLPRCYAFQFCAATPEKIRYEDIFSAGCKGLIQAVESYDIERGVLFETFAIFRIRGAIIDYLREIDWLPRSIRIKSKIYKEAVSSLCYQLERKPTEKEIADYLKITVEKAYDLEQSSIIADMQGIQDKEDEEDEHRGSVKKNGYFPSMGNVAGSNGKHPLERLMEKESFNQMLSCLKKKERIVLKLYYRCNLNFRVIGKKIGLHESAACRIHKDALQKIKNAFGLVNRAAV